MRALKRMYNKWLYKRYGYRANFDLLPYLLTHNKLFSPSLYTYCWLKEVSIAISDGYKEGLKKAGY